jgi:hypothetical protein
MKKKTRASISMNQQLFRKFKLWCQTNEVPLGAVVEVLTARDIGMPLSELPKHVQPYVDRITAQLASKP